MADAELDVRIDALETEIRAKRREMRALLAQRAGMPVKDYELETTSGVTTLSALFDGKRDLILVHNMGSGCAYCSLWADGFNGVLEHLQDRAAFVVVSPDLPSVQAEFASRRGWRFRMASDQGDFTADMGYVRMHDGRAWHMPGVSAFRMDDDGSIRRVSADFFGPGDAYCSVFHLFDLLEGGVGDWQVRAKYEGERFVQVETPTIEKLKG